MEQTKRQARNQPVTLWVEDTTELDYTMHNSKTGLGPIGDGKGRGLLMHSTIGIQPDKRTVLGLGHVQVLLRQATPKKTVHWIRSPEARVWEVSAESIGKPDESNLWVHVSDSGSDIFEYMAMCKHQNKEFVLRVYHNRILAWEEDAPEAEQEEARKLCDYARSLAEYPGSEREIEVAATKKQAARKAHVVAGWAPITVPAPQRAPIAEALNKPISAWVLRVWEPQPPEGVEVIEWILITSLPILSLEDAFQITDWYTCRWFCEDFHQCLKTGCQIEKSQLSDAADIQNLLGFAAPIAIRLLQLRQEARNAPETPAVQVVDPLMVEVLARKEKIKPETLTAKEFFRWIARLGGFLGRKRDGDPGWRTLWQGWRYLSDLTDGARLFLPKNTS